MKPVREPVFIPEHQDASVPHQNASVAHQYASVAHQYASVAHQNASVPRQYASVAHQNASVPRQYASVPFVQFETAPSQKWDLASFFTPVKRRRIKEITARGGGHPVASPGAIPAC
jgi:hypothetical protein